MIQVAGIKVGISSHFPLPLPPSLFPGSRRLASAVENGETGSMVNAATCRDRLILLGTHGICRSDNGFNTTEPYLPSHRNISPQLSRAQLPRAMLSMGQASEMNMCWPLCYPALLLRTTTNNNMTRAVPT